MGRSLLLNANYEPLCFITHNRAMRLLLREKVEPIHAGDPASTRNACIRFVSGVMWLPAVVRLKKWVRIPPSTPRFQKSALFNRDGWSCQYCGSRVAPKAATVDHVVPRSRGGATSWQNCVTACARCNTKKRDMTPEQAGMQLRRQPSLPKSIHFMCPRLSEQQWHPDWNFFLGGGQNT